MLNSTMLLKKDYSLTFGNKYITILFSKKLNSLIYLTMTTKKG